MTFDVQSEKVAVARKVTKVQKTRLHFGQGLIDFFSGEEPAEVDIRGVLGLAGSGH